MPKPDNNPAHREETLFAAAFDLPADERPAFLEQQCRGDHALRRRIEQLLKALDEGDLLEAAPTGLAELSLLMPSDGPASEPLTEKVGDRIGRYKLLQLIGAGGCGVVYLAEREGSTSRVALKVVKREMETRQVLESFEPERRALKEHPGIASVLDAGSTETGRPYFVMELVSGVRITQHCDAHKLSLHERLELFAQVCGAVQRAHEQGVIHGNLKPSNVRVTMLEGAPAPKILDFGIARATRQQRLADKTLFTAFGQFISTPAYLSPELAQASEVGIDSRSDVYSLGVMLYELLTGTAPFEIERLLRSGLEGMRKIVCEEAPPKPSSRLAALGKERRIIVARQRGTKAPGLVRALRGDLDSMVMKALEKDRAARYESAGALGGDVGRYLRHEAVMARPPGRLRRWWRFCWGRNR